MDEIPGAPPAEAGTTPERRPRGPYKTKKRAETERLRDSRAMAKNHLATAGRMIAGCPTTPDELASQWQIGADDVETVTVKVLRQVIGSQEQELVASVPLIDYDGERIAGNFGPGTYYLRPAAGSYARNSAKLPISETMARNCGWGRVPTRAVDAIAERTIRAAAEGPTNPVDLVAAIETVMDRKRIEWGLGAPGVFPGHGQGMAAGPAQPAAVDPLQAMRAQFEQIQAMMAFMGSLEERAIRTVEMRMGKVQDMEPTDTNASLLEKLLPKALDIFGAMMANRNQAPAPPPQAPAPPKVVNPQPAPAPAPQPAPAAQEAPTMPELPELTEHERQVLGMAVRSLQPYASTLVNLSDQVADDSVVVDQIEPWIPEAMVPNLAALSELTKAKGPVILAAIHPGLGTERWAGIMARLVEVCNS